MTDPAPAVRYPEGRWRGRIGGGLPWWLLVPVAAALLGAAYALEQFEVPGGALLVVMFAVFLGVISRQMELRATTEGVIYRRVTIPWSRLREERHWLGPSLRVEPPVRLGPRWGGETMARVPLWCFAASADNGTRLTEIVDAVRAQQREQRGICGE